MIFFKHFRILNTGEPQEFFPQIREKTLAHKKRPRRAFSDNQSKIIHRLRCIQFLLKCLEVLAEDLDR